MIRVKVERMFLSNMGFVVLLKGDDNPKALPIFIGAAEAHAIALWINNVEIPRPMTHDLMKNILDCMECRTRRVVVTELREGTFYANIVLDINGEDTVLDARPSDAIALALRTGAQIFVSDKVMQEAGRVFNEKGEEQAQLAETPQVSELDKLKESLAKAVSEERYEDAAGIRDRIRQIEHQTTQN